ncbi:MAG: ubiquitin-like small modifier protein 1 [Thermoprotei archaeon]
MKVTVRYFARVREGLGRSSDEVELDGEPTLMDLLRLLVEKYPILKGIIFEADSKTLNKFYQVMVSGERVAGLDRKLREGDVVAIIPPVAGG